MSLVASINLPDTIQAPSLPPPQYSPPLAPDGVSPPITPQTLPNAHKWVFTQEQKQRFAADFAIQSAKAYGACRREEHPWRCGVIKIITGMSSDEKEAICTDPDMLHDFVGITIEHEQDVLDLLHCTG
jgi:hypothetical protein